MMACVSHTDAQEAEATGRAAVRRLVAGQSDIIITLQRNPGVKYSCSTGIAPLTSVGSEVKRMPARFLDPDSHLVTQEFLDYARPLLGDPLPHYGRLFS